MAIQKRKISQNTRINSQNESRKCLFVYDGQDMPVVDVALDGVMETDICVYESEARVKFFDSYGDMYELEPMTREIRLLSRKDDVI